MRGSIDERFSVQSLAVRIGGIVKGRCILLLARAETLGRCRTGASLIRIRGRRARPKNMVCTFVFRQSAELRSCSRTRQKKKDGLPMNIRRYEQCSCEHVHRKIIKTQKVNDFPDTDTCMSAALKVVRTIECSCVIGERSPMTSQSSP